MKEILPEVERWLEDGEQHGATATLANLVQPADDRHSTRSRNTSISPPHGSPTDHARSSLIP